MNPVIPSNVNAEAAVFRGCTTTEMVAIMAVCSGFWIPITLIIGAAINKIMISLSFSILLIGGSTFALAVVLQEVKSGKPDGYYMHVVHKFMNKIMVGKAALIFNTCSWDVQRSKPIVIVNRKRGAKDE